MTKTVKIELELTADTPQSTAFADTYEGLANVWYRFSTDPEGNIDLWATPDGYEHLARWFLKLARTGKASGYHGHFALESGGGPSAGGPELTVGVTDTPDHVA